MSVGNLFHRILTEWSFLEKQLLKKDTDFVKKKPSHNLTEDLDIEFSIKLDASNQRHNENQALKPKEVINYEQNVIIIIHQSGLKIIDEKILEGLNVKISNIGVNLFKVKFSAYKEKNPQFSLFISYLILYMSDRTFKTAYQDALVDLKKYWSSYSLGREIQIGLFGELHVLDLVADLIGWSNALETWKGPDSGLHDFVFKDTSVEVKTTETDPPKIYVDNPEQFFIPGTKKLYLNVCNVYVNDGLDLEERVEELNHKYGNDLNNVFHAKLYDYGYFNKLLSTKLLKINFINSQEVHINNPEMTLNKNILDNLPQSVTRVKYTLDTSNFDFSPSDPNRWIDDIE
jgi:hypothetical protein